MTESPRHALSPRSARAAAEVARVLAGERPHLVLRTSGSTGEPRRVALAGAALRASAVASLAHLGGDGRWLLALPTDHVAGVQVLVRGLVAGLDPIEVDTSQGFRTGAFAAATSALVAADAVSGTAAPRRYTSLVPTQLRRLLGDEAGRLALLTYDAVLVGGAASDPHLLDAAREAGARVVTTYGMTETSGGCVYDGVPLDGVEVRTDPDGRVLLRGPVLTSGYLSADGTLDREATAPWLTTDGWWRTNDAGRLADGRLEILGRLDDMIVTGGVNVAPARIEAEVDAWLSAAGGGESCVVGVPDPEWGERVVAVVRCDGDQSRAALADAAGVRGLREHVARTLGRESAPRDVVVTERLALRGPGKIDRRAARATALAALSGARPPDHAPRTGAPDAGAPAREDR